MSVPKRMQALALFPNLAKYRNELGWTLPYLVAKVDGNPAESSIRRLEAGRPIREPAVQRLFNTINAAMNGTLVRNDEIIFISR